jgi:integrase
MMSPTSNGPAALERSGPGIGGVAPMQSQPSPHRTDLKRGKRERVAPGVFVRGGKYEIGYVDASGVDRMKTLGPVKSESAPNGLTLKDAKAEREKLRVNARAGEVVVPSKMTFGEVADDFLTLFESLVAAGERSERTLELYKQRHRCYLEPRFGRLPIQKITPDRVARLLAELRSQGKKPWTIKGIYVLLGGIFNHAMSRGLVAESPLKRLSRAERPKARASSKPRVLSHDEIRRLLDYAIDGYRPLLATAVFSGMRLSELLGLRWQDVDFEAGLIHVRHQLSRATKRKPARLLPLKTDAGSRDIVLLPELGRLLKEHKAAAFQRGYARTEDYVFSTAIGTPFYGRNVSVRGLDKAADRAGLNGDQRPRVSMHDLRHTFASHLILDLKLDIVTVSRQLGHARPSITSDVYAHLFDQARHHADIRERMAESDFGKLLEARSG